MFKWNLIHDKFKLATLFFSFIVLLSITLCYSFNLITSYYLLYLTIPTIIWLMLIMLTWICLIQKIARVKAGQFKILPAEKKQIQKIKIKFFKTLADNQVVIKMAQYDFYIIVFYALCNVLLLFIFIGFGILI